MNFRINIVRQIVAIFLLTFSFSAVSGIHTSDLSSAGFDKLTESQKAEIITHIEKTSGGVKTTPKETAEAVNEWVDIGTNIGKGLAGAAKELGVAANEFADTKVGKLAAFVIIYHFVGESLLGMIVHVFGGFIIMGVGIHLINRVKKNMTVDAVYYNEKGKKERVDCRRLSGDAVAGFLCAYGIVMLISLMTIFTW